MTKGQVEAGECGGSDKIIPKNAKKFQKMLSFMNLMLIQNIKIIKENIYNIIQDLLKKVVIQMIYVYLVVSNHGIKKLKKQEENNV